MFGFLKKLGKKSETVAPLIPVAVPLNTPAHAAVMEPVYPAHLPMMDSAAGTMMPRAAAPVARTPVPRPARVAPPSPPPTYEFSPTSFAPAPAVEVPAATPPPAVIVELPLKKLWHKLNPTVIQGATSHPNGDCFLRLPLPLLHAQLAKGAVKLPFAHFRRYSPEGLFPANPEKDTLEVDLPLCEILPLLEPGHLARRPNQRTIQVPDDIGPIFGPNGGPAHGLRIAETKARVPAAPAHVPAPAAPAPLPAPIASFTPAPVPEDKIAAPALPPMAPIAKAPAPLPVTPQAPPPSPPAPVPEPIRNEPISAPSLDPSLASLKPRKPELNGAAPAAPAAKNLSVSAETAATGTFTIALMDVAAFWSEKGKNELSNLYRHSLEIPMSTLESALKNGKLIFQWREIRPWLRLAPGNTMPTLQDDLAIELPLSIIAPRFIEHRAQGKPKNRVDVGDIPDVFEQKSPLPGASTTLSAPVLGATSVPMDFSAALAAPGKTGDTAFLTAAAGKPLLEFGEIFGQPEKKNWTLSEVAQKTMTLRGVAGAIIGSSDGLLVAGAWPNGVKGDGVAAFLPQMYSRILHYSKELKLGEPGNFTLTIDNIPLQLFKAGNSFFTVIGRAGENLPKAQLNALAMRLATNFSGK